MTLTDELYSHINALQRRADHHRKQKLTAVSKHAANDHLMCMTELSRQADDLKAIVDRHTKRSPPG